MIDFVSERQRGRVTAAVYGREMRHSRRVRRLKVLLPAAAALVMLAMAGRSAVHYYLSQGPVSIAGAMIQDGRLIMEGPRMGGLSGNKRPYEMNAARAIQSIKDAGFVDLEQIIATLPVGSADWAEVTAATGTMTKADNMMRITSPAVIKTTDGMVARLQSARVDMGSGDIASDEAVQIDTRDMTVNADSMRITGGGAVMTFERRVKVRIDGGRPAAAEASDAGN